jgi:hypothetical protein
MTLQTETEQQVFFFPDWIEYRMKKKNMAMDTRLFITCCQFLSEIQSCMVVWSIVTVTYFQFALRFICSAATVFVEQRQRRNYTRNWAR